MQQDVKVVKVGTHGYYDVFMGMGWTHHVRVRMVKGDNIVVPEGKALSPSTTERVKQAIKKGQTKFVNGKVVAK
jgi:hypothetical protein